MKIEIRNDSVIIDGYVNAVGRDSRPIRSQTGQFVEQVEPGTFSKALQRAKKVDLLLNHNSGRLLGSTAAGNLELTEDSIGLRAHATVTDPEVIDKARNGMISGWSFGMYVNKDEMEQRGEALPRRILKDIDIFEVSLIDNTMRPCYAGTSVECRAEAEDILSETRANEDTVDVVMAEGYVHESVRRAEKYLEQLRAECQIADLELKAAELRYNPYHNPKDGRFSSGKGGGDYLFMVPKGQAGQGILLKNADIADSKLANAYYHSVYENSNINNGKHNLVNGANANTTASASGDGAKFGVSGGVGTAYTLVSTQDGNKLIRNDYIIENADGSLSISVKSLLSAKKRDISPDYAASEHSAEPNVISGVAKGNKMTFEEADNGKANPHYRPYSGYSKNCQSAVVVHEARMRGYDIETKAKSGAVMRDLSHDTTLAWIDPKTGKKPQLSALTGNKGVELDRIVKSGERYSLEYMHDRRSGHIITVSRDENNKIRLYDPQTNKKITGKTEINNYLKGKLDVRYLRVDNLDFNETVVDAISKKSGKRR